MSFSDEMDKLAATIAQEANADSKPLADRIDAFKALHPYYVLLLKQKRNNADDEDTFESFASAIADAEEDNGSTVTPIRSGGRGN